MTTMLIAFLPVAALLTITPGVGTALVVRSAVTGGQRQALRTIVGNEIGVLTWAILAAVGVAAIVAASVELFTVIKLIGAAVLIVMGIQSLLAGSHRKPAHDQPRGGSSALRGSVHRAKQAFVEGPWMRRVERLTGGVLVALGARLAFEER